MEGCLGRKNEGENMLMKGLESNLSFICADKYDLYLTYFSDKNHNIA